MADGNGQAEKVRQLERRAGDNDDAHRRMWSRFDGQSEALARHDERQRNLENQVKALQSSISTVDDKVDGLSDLISKLPRRVLGWGAGIATIVTAFLAVLAFLIERATS